MTTGPTTPTKDQDELKNSRCLLTLVAVLLTEVREIFIHKHANYGDPEKNPRCSLDAWNCTRCPATGYGFGQHSPDCIVERIDNALWAGEDKRDGKESRVTDAIAEAAWGAARVEVTRWKKIGNGPRYALIPFTTANPEEEKRYMGQIFENEQQADAALSMIFIRAALEAAIKEGL